MADRDAMELLKTECKKINGRFEVGLPWKNPDAKLPDSYDNAYRCVMSLKNKRWLVTTEYADSNR